MTSLLIAAQTAAQTSSAELSVWDLCLKGGIIMIPLALLSLVSIYIFFERWFALRKAAKDDDTFMKRIKDYIHDGEIESADMLCKKTATPYARLIQKGISRIGRPMNDVLVAIENVGNIEVAKLGKGFTWLATTAAGAPMLGFFAMANAGANANISVLAGGIYEALTTTVAGLVVGIIALFAYNYLSARVNHVMNQLENKTMEFMDLLNEPASK